MDPTRKILVIDDEIHIVSIVKRRFESAGWTVCVARNGREGVAAALSDVPDLVIVDYQMPELDGLGTVEALRAAEATRGVPIVMLTARGHLVDESRLAAAGVVALMQKPFSARDLQARAESIVGGGEGVARGAA